MSDQNHYRYTLYLRLKIDLEKLLTNYFLSKKCILYHVTRLYFLSLLFFWRTIFFQIGTIFVARKNVVTDSRNIFSASKSITVGAKCVLPSFVFMCLKQVRNSLNPCLIFTVKSMVIQLTEHFGQSQNWNSKAVHVGAAGELEWLSTVSHQTLPRGRINRFSAERRTQQTQHPIRPSVSRFAAPCCAAPLLRN